MCLLTEDNDNPIIIRPHIVFTDGRQQQQPNHNTTTKCLLTNDKNDNPIIIRPHIVFTDDDNNDNPIITRPHIVFTDGRQ